MWHIQLGASHFANGGIKWGQGVGKLNPNIFGLFEPQLGQKANKINFGNKNGKNDNAPDYQANVATLMPFSKEDKILIKNLYECKG